MIDDLLYTEQGKYNRKKNGKEEEKNKIKFSLKNITPSFTHPFPPAAIHFLFSADTVQ